MLKCSHVSATARWDHGGSHKYQLEFSQTRPVCSNGTINKIYFAENEILNRVRLQNNTPHLELSGQTRAGGLLPMAQDGSTGKPTHPRWDTKATPLCFSTKAAHELIFLTLKISQARIQCQSTRSPPAWLQKIHDRELTPLRYSASHCWVIWN